MEQIKNIAIIILIALAAFLGANNIKTANRYESNLKASDNTIKTYINDKKQLVSSVQSLQATNKEIKNGLWIKDDSLKAMVKEFKELKATVIIETKTVHDTIFVPFDTPIDCNGKTFSKSFKKETDNYFIAGLVTNDDVAINQFVTRNTQRIVIGTKRSWFKTTMTADVTNSNKSIKITGMQSQTTTVRTKRFGIGGTFGLNALGDIQATVGITYIPVLIW